MTRWTIDGIGDTGSRAQHSYSGELVEYNVQRLSGGYWLSELVLPDGSRFQVDTSERSEAGLPEAA